MMLTRTYTGRTRPARKNFTPDYTGMGDSHNPTSSQNHMPIIPLPSRPNGNRTGISYGYGYTRGSGRSITLISKLCGCAASLSLLSLASLPPSFPSSFISTSSPGHG